MFRRGGHIPDFSKIGAGQLELDCLSFNGHKSWGLPLGPGAPFDAIQFSVCGRTAAFFHSSWLPPQPGGHDLRHLSEQAP
jgi:hypothetical protein